MKSKRKNDVAAVVVAAGLSSRMGRPKQLLPYGEYTIIEQIVSVLLQYTLAEVVVVTGHERKAIEAKLAPWPIRSVFNPDYRSGEMLSSLQYGLSALTPEIEAALVVLGDQPQLEVAVVQHLVETYRANKSRLLIPKFQERRGHPILIDRTYWPDILALTADRTLRDIIVLHAADIDYVKVETDSILRDIDTPEAYQQELRALDKKNP